MSNEKDDPRFIELVSRMDAYEAAFLAAKEALEAAFADLEARIASLTDEAGQ